MIDLGAPYQIPPFAVTDANGQPANADTVTLTITQPDGSTATPAVANPPAVTGTYVPPQFVPVMPGRHMYRWLAGNPPGAYADVFEVADSGPPSIVSLADAKEFLGMDAADTTDDDELRAWLAGTTRVVERVKNEVIAMRQVTETGMNHKGDQLRLWKVPVISLDSLARWDGTYTWNVQTDVYTDTETGLVDLVSGPSLHGRITAIYTAGYKVVPYEYQQGALVLLQHVWETQRGPGTIGGGVIGPEEAADYKQAFMLPRKVREWLGAPRPVVA